MIDMRLIPTSNLCRQELRGSFLNLKPEFFAGI
jgi:hypothetical protein